MLKCRYNGAGPNRAIDEVLPGRTTERDLILDLMTALERVRNHTYWAGPKDFDRWVLG